MRVRTREGPFLHRFAIRHINDQPTARFKNSKDFGGVIAVRVKEVSCVDDQNLVESGIDPGKRTELSFDELHPACSDRSLIHVCGLLDHSIRLVYSEKFGT